MKSASERMAKDPPYNLGNRALARCLKALLLALFCTPVLAEDISYPSLVLEDHPVAYWRFSSDAGQSAQNVAHPDSQSLAAVQ